MAGKLLAAGFERGGPSATALSDPIADTPMVVTLDQLRPYDHDPRKSATRPTMKSRPPSASAAWMRRPPSHAVLARRTTSSATAATPGWRSCVNSGRRPRTSAFPHIVPVPALACARGDRRPDWASRRERTARRPHVHRARLGRREGARSSMKRKAARRASPSWPVAWAPTASPCSSRTSAAWPMRCATCCRRSQPCSMVASVATRSSGCRSCARPVSARGSSMPRAAPAAGLRQFLPRSAVAVRYPGRRVFAAACAGRVDRSDVRAAGHRLRRARPGPDRIREPPPRPGQRPNPPSAPPTLPEPGAIARAPIEPAPSPLQQHLLQATLRPRRRGPRTMRSERASAASPAAAAGGLLDEHIISPAPTTERLQSIQRMVADQLGDVLPPDFSANVLQSIPVQAGASSHLGHLAYRPWPRHTRPPAHPHRAVRARDRGRGRPGRMCRGSF